jgi:uncharacterized protein (DUF1697 family)
VTTYVAFVRAVMIGREGLHRQVLLDVFADSGAQRAASYISTGNVSFELADDDQLDELVDTVERGVTGVVGRETEVFVRSIDELSAIHRRQPFAATPFPEFQDAIVIMFRDRVPERLRLPIESPRGDWVVFAAGPREVFAVVRDVDGRRQSPGGVIERLAGERMTSRAWSTIDRIVTKLT